MQQGKDFARLPDTLNLAAFVEALQQGMGSSRPDLELSSTLAVNPKTLRSWLEARQTERGPSVQIYTANFEALCAEGRKQGRNVELYYDLPASWSPSRGPILPPPVRIGKHFKCHGVKIGGIFLDSPLILTAGVFSDRGDDMRWFLDTGFSGVETKTRLSHERPSHRQDQLLTPQELPSLGFGNHPRRPHNLLMQQFDRISSRSRGVGVRLGAPSQSPASWVVETDRVVAGLRRGQVLMLSIGAHVPRSPAAFDRQAVLADWRKVAESAAQTRADIVVANVSCSAFANYYEDLEFVAEVCRAVRRIVKTQKLFIKLAYLPEKQLEQLLLAVAGEIDGVIAINCEIATACSIDLEEQLTPTWGDLASRVGIAGPPLFPLNCSFLKQFVRLRARHDGLKHLAIVACGGVYHEDQVTELLGMGADCVGINSALFHDAFFGFKARRYLDSEWDRRSSRMNEEGVRLLEVWSAAYESEVASLPVDSPEWATRHRNAMRLLDRVMVESRSRLGLLEDAAAGGAKPPEVMSLLDMREKIREGF